MIDDVRVGGRVATLVEARAWVCGYFDRVRNETGSSPFAYPAYHELSTGDAPSELTDCDLLAPTLLSAAPSLAAFYWLRSIRPVLEEALAAIPVDLTLQQAVARNAHPYLLAGLVGVLDDGGRRGVRLTTLMKVLHRKRPLFVPLYDRYVGACYVGRSEAYPLRPNLGRAWRDFIVALAEAMAADLDTQPAAWRRLISLAHETASSPWIEAQPVSPLRVLDVVAWNLCRPATGRRRRS
jgi:hypothetical protein